VFNSLLPIRQISRKFTRNSLSYPAEKQTDKRR